ncbi:MAG: hypothetical protein FWG15_01830 [Propionibacteriaceae bacterium]|jgi:putative hydrolase of the HAD superfamily|nr:hypothetical protein [Propionibacteriaceae bacterium]
MGIKVLALDAMGVIYRHADDVEELLIPYLRDRGCVVPTAQIEELYHRCSLGQISSTGDTLFR